MSASGHLFLVPPRKPGQGIEGESLYIQILLNLFHGVFFDQLNELGDILCRGFA
jgi:hypothetical protein